ncbi:uncharacterized protein LOC133733717 isoform X1 [Rosa rugosa]|uniref:uncharacterized protein LOC133733717 isoform X1 n=1 Tax=Rosa rugosa TaxID=74645 RepID=UPI002B417705|nr:uncharacterized protein LOC133733717 isoform X1 [Rosa rugosa]
MSFSSTRNYLARSGFRFPFQRTQFQRTQFVRSFWQKDKGLLDLMVILELWDLEFRHMQRGRTASLKGQIENLKVRGFCAERRKDGNQPIGHRTIVMDQPFYKKLKIMGDQEQILSILTELYIISEVKLTLATKGLFSCLYEHGVEDTWRAFVETMKGRANTSSDSYLKRELEKMEKWLDNVEPLAKEIYQVLVVRHGQKVSKPRGEYHFEILPNSFGSILIKLSKLRLKWKAIASLEHGNLLDELDKRELDYVETLIKEVHNFVVVQQLLQE